MLRSRQRTSHSYLGSFLWFICGFVVCHLASLFSLVDSNCCSSTSSTNASSQLDLSDIPTTCDQSGVACGYKTATSRYIRNREPVCDMCENLDRIHNHIWNFQFYGHFEGNWLEQWKSMPMKMRYRFSLFGQIGVDFAQPSRQGAPMTNPDEFYDLRFTSPFH